MHDVMFIYQLADKEMRDAKDFGRARMKRMRRKIIMRITRSLVC